MSSQYLEGLSGRTQGILHPVFMACLKEVVNVAMGPI